MSTKSLRERRVVLNNQISEIVNNAESENRDLTTAENDLVENLLAEDTALKNRIARLEQNDSRAAELAQLIEPQRIGNGMHHAAGSIGDVGFNRQSHDATDLDRCIAAFARNASGMQARPDEWEAANRLGLLPNGAGLTVNFALNRPTIGRDVSLMGEQNGMVKYSPKRGGVTVPAGFMQALEVALKAHGPMLNVSQVWVSEDGRESMWPTIDDTGEMGEQIHEAETVSPTELNFKAFRFGAFKFTSGLVRVSHELGRDSAVNLAVEIGSAFGTRLARRLNHDCTVGGSRGSGIRGILQDSVLGKEAVAGIQADNIIQLISSLDGAYRSSPDCAFMMHPQVFDGISSLKDLNGNYLIGDFQEGAVPRLRGYPVHFNPDMTDAVTPGSKPIIFGDLSKYKLRIVGQIRFRQLLEKFADSDETGFVSFIEADGALLDAGTHPVKHLQIKSYEEE